MIPTLAQCCQLMATHHMLDNIKAHSIMVARIAEFLTRELNRQGLDICPNRAVSGALLHDIGKSLCLDNDTDHAHKGREICETHGFYDIAELVAEHVILGEAFPERPLSAKEIVYYADKRVKHDKIVSLNERLDYILDRYGLGSPTHHQAIRINFQRCRHIEKEIFTHLTLDPANLASKVLGINGTVVDFFQ